MKLATFNVNSVRRRVPHIRRFLERQQPDLVMLQETKCQAEEMPGLEFRDLGYAAHARCGRPRSWPDCSCLPPPP